MRQARSVVIVPSAILVFSLMFLSTFISTAWSKPSVQSQFETPQNRRASQFLPADVLAGPHHRVRETVVCYGYMDHFTVDSDFGQFHVTGDAALRKLVREIGAIAVLRKVQNSQVYMDALRNAGRQPLEFGVNLITDPVDTLSGVPKGVTRLFENVSASLGSKPKAGEDGNTEKLLAVSNFKRQYATALGVDVYSSNTVLQQELNRLGWAGALGNLTLSAALAPVGGPAVMAVSGTRLGQQMNDLLTAEPPARLRIVNGEKLAGMGVPTDLAQAFLNKTVYSPRHTTVIVTCLGALTGARGRDAFIGLAMAADDEETANFYQHMAETLREYHVGVSPIKEIVVVPPLAFARAANGNVLIPFPLDYGVWSERAGRAVPALLSDYRNRQAPFKKYEIWITGTLSPLARQNLVKLGAEVSEDVDKKVPFLD